MLSAMRSRGGALARFVVVALLGGCAVGPDFTQPAPPAVSGYLSAADGRDNGAGRYRRGADVPGEWWSLLGSSYLDDLIRRGIANSPDVRAQEAAIMAAHHAWQAQRGALFPAVGANYNFTRQKTPSSTLSSGAASEASIYSVHTAKLTASFVPDVFGGTRRAIEASAAQLAIEQHRREAVVLTMTANIVLAAIQEASLRGQIAATKRLIEAQQEVLRLLRRQESAGQIALTDVLQQETALAQAQLTLPPLEKQLGQQRNLLAVLVGSFPSEGATAKFELAALRLPQALPLSLPADLVQQRPDIRVAGETVHAASAQVGVAIANRLPQIKITGDAGSAALAFAKLFSPGTGLWTFATDVAQPIFDGFALREKQKVAEAQLQQAMEQYRGVVLVAFQNVADALLALDADAKALTYAVAAERSASRTIELLRRQLDQGQISLPSLLTAQQAYLQTSLARVQAEAARLSDVVVLFQALGGGWWNRPMFVAEAERQASR